jgi:hypothetical protein
MWCAAYPILWHHFLELLCEYYTFWYRSEVPSILSWLRVKN